jgi:hypothetical protein
MRCHRTRLLSFAAVVVLLSGCSLKYTIDEPAPSRFSYQNVDKKTVVMKVIDQRDDAKFSPGISGLKSVDIVFENVQDPVSWLSKGMEKEFAARGIPMQIVGKESNAAADMTLAIRKYQVVNHRASGFSAWEAYHLFLGQVTMGEKSCSVPAYFFNSKIPVWSMDEVAKPCLSIPMSVMVKEIVSKINRCVFNYSASDDDLKRMEEAALENVKPDSETACFPAIELGGTNNPAAMKTLQKIAGNEDSLVHACAVSAIGTLGAQDQFDFLARKFDQFSNNDKIIPLKSIGDIGSSQAMDFMRKIRADKLYSDENGVKYCVDLYLDREAAAGNRGEAGK